MRTPRQIAEMVITANKMTGVYDPSSEDDLIALLMHAARMGQERK